MPSSPAANGNLRQRPNGVSATTESKSTTTSNTITNMNKTSSHDKEVDSKVIMEFGGPMGVLFLMIPDIWHKIFE
jgi:hypothetical protein